jgi:hypothetical protein
VAKHEKHFQVALKELKDKKESYVCKNSLIEIFQLIKIDISNSYLDYIMKSIMVEVKSLKEITWKHFLKLFKRKDERNNSNFNIAYKDDNLDSYLEKSPKSPDSNYGIKKNVINESEFKSIEQKYLFILKVEKSFLITKQN